jgi:selenocysteine lyase/cysteine desulfurase
VKASLAAAGIHVWTSEALSARLDMEQRGLPAVVRASPHAFNSEDETRRLVEHVRLLVEHPPPSGGGR